MKILYFITRSDTIGGAQIHVRDLALEFMALGHDVTVVVGGNGQYVDFLTLKGINVKALPELGRSFSFLNDMRSIYFFRKLLKEYSPDILSIHSAKAGLIGRLAAILLPVPVIFTAHGWSHIRVSSGIRWWIYIILERVLGSFCEYVVTVCKEDFIFSCDQMGMRKEKLICIHNGMPDIDISAGKEKKEILITSVARFQEPKDFDTLVNALYRIKDMPWKFQFIGDGPLLEQTKLKIESLELSHKVIFIGASNQVGSQLADSDIYVLISLSEGFPRSILEALRASLPIVASDVGGVKESVFNGVNGYLIGPRDSKELANKLGVLIQSKVVRDKYGSNSRAIYEQNFTFNRMFKSTYSLYCKVTKNS